MRISHRNFGTSSARSANSNNKESQAVLNLRNLFTCLTTDIITEYALARSYDLLSTPDLSPKWRQTFESGLRKVHCFKHFPWLWRIVHSVPDRLITAVSPDFQLTLDFERDNQKQVREVMTGDRFSSGKLEHPTIFHELLQSGLPPAEKSHARLWQEGQSILGAGTETTANTLNVITLNLLNQP